MEISTENDNKTILKNDPDFPEYLDFQLLRSTGITHLGNLSGKLWTDHNVHDPGITILEMLCYALIDLGYRTQLPIQDILALDRRTGPYPKEDNFFTPGQVLTCNPVTVMDYRKLLIDTPGIRNAWLEISEEHQLYLKRTFSNDGNEMGYELSCDSGSDQPDDQFTLNGLYNVYLELERPGISCPSNYDPGEVEQIITAVKEKLHAHRNLCEDFVKIHVLCEEEISFCGNIVLAPEADAEKVHVEIFKALYEFLSPTIHFYTLEEMLDQGVPVEKIFSGRPWLQESYGFIKEEELEKAEQKKEIYLSDVYSLIGSIEGVVSVTNLKLKSYGSAGNPASCDYWVHRLAKDHVPVFCAEETCFEFSKEGANGVKTNRTRVNALFGEYISSNKKLRFLDALDKTIPQSTHLPELDDYYSIQNEFPRTYAIGEGGLPSDATDKRKAQALQLKGYLLFYDQLLANYLSQLSHLRDLFSFQPDSLRPEASRHTYFGGEVDTVPQIDKLVRFYTDNFEVSAGWVENTVLALPVSMDMSEKGTVEEAQFLPVTFPTYDEREVGICQLQREFRQNEYQIHIVPDECGFIFSIVTSVGSIHLHSKRTYKSHSDAQQAAKTVAFLATLENTWLRVNDYDNNEFTFELIYKPVEYLNYLQSILEDKNTYVERRGMFLDHLLDRFAEDFTDYALLAYGQGNPDPLNQTALKEQENECKALFLSDYPEINRDRGRAFNYQLNGWDNENISGLEKRVAAKSCMESAKRQTLCNFGIHQYDDEYVYEIPDAEGNVLFRSVEKYKSRDEARKAYESFINTVGEAGSFLTEDRPEENKFGIMVRHPQGMVSYTRDFDNRVERDLHIKKLTTYLSPGSISENIRVTEYVSRLTLVSAAGVRLKQSRKQYASPELAEKDRNTFAEKINNQLWIDDDVDRVKYQLLPTSEDSVFLDRQSLGSSDQYVTGQYRWALAGQDALTWVKSTEAFNNEEEARQGLLRFLDFDPDTLTLESADRDGSYGVEIRDQGGTTLARGIFGEDRARDNVKYKLDQFISSAGTGHTWLRQKTEAYAWELWNDDDTLLQSHVLYDDTRKAQAAADKVRKLIQKEENFKILTLEGGGYQLAVATAQETLATSPVLHASEEEARALIPQINAAWERRGFVITEGETGYQYTIPQEENDQDAVLASYAIYRSKAGAIDAIHELLDTARRKTAYYPTGDEANLNFSFLIRAKGSRFLAQHPFNYNTEAERDKALEATLKILKATRQPFTAAREYIYQLKQSGEILLASEESFATEEQAVEGFTDMLRYVSDPKNYEKTTETGGYSHHLTLNNENGRPVAAYPYDYVKWDEGDRIIGRITNYFAPHRYAVSVEDYPHQWKYRYGWLSYAGEWSTLMQGSEGFDSEQQARQGYRDFTDHLSKVKIKAEHTEGSGARLKLISGKEKVWGESPDVFSSEELSAVEKAAKEYLASAVEYANVMKTAIKNVEKAVLRTPGVVGGNFVYRAVKKDECIAWYPCSCEAEPLRDTLERLYGIAQAGFPYLEICLGGDICEKIGNLYHFLLRDQHSGQIYFKSYQGYPTEEEARTAFDELHLLVIHKASDAGNYGPYDPDNAPVILTGEEFEHNTGPCSGKKQPIAVVSQSALEKYSIEQLADLACSYPIRMQITVKEEDCRNYEEICYYFHLINPHRDEGDECKEAWKSKECYDTPEATRTAFRLFLKLLNYKGNYHHQYNKDKCCYELVIREILLESEQGYPTEAEAWQALESVLKVACDPEACHIFWDEEKCYFIIRVVLPDYEMACHPVVLYQREQAEQRLESIYNNTIKSAPEQQYISVFSLGENTGVWGFAISTGNEQTLWRSQQEYSTHDEAENAAWLVTELAREESFYGTSDGSIALFTKNRNFATPTGEDLIARYPGDDLDTAQLIRRALEFPLLKDSKGYFFRLFDTTSAPDPTGPSVLWKSNKHYPTQDEVREAFDHAYDLSQDKIHYEIIEGENCDSFKISLTDPSQVLASHPQRYGLKPEVDEALSRIMACTNLEGMHLVEHILLRPQTSRDCECFLTPWPDPDCTLDIPLPEKDPCSEDRSDNEVPEVKEYIPGADPYSFWATVVLPGWTKRFRRLENRDILQNMLRREAPAHVALNILWLGPGLMCKFEEEYRRWLRWKSCKPLCQEGDPLCDLISCIGDLVSSDPELPDEDDDDCNCDLPGTVDKTNLMINYCFHNDREVAYGSEFLGSLGVEKGFTFSGLGNILTISRAKLPSVFKGVQPAIDVNVAEPKEEAGKEPVVTKETLTEEEIAQGIRQRIAAYKSNIEEIGDAKFRASEAYQRSVLFLSSPAAPDIYTGLMKILQQGYQRARSEAGKDRYLTLMSNVTAYFTDQQIASDHDKVAKDVKKALEETVSGTEAGELRSKINEVWKVQDWQNWYASKAARDVQKLLKK